jgi:phage-related protein
VATVGSANIDITADDSQARQEVQGFFGFLQGAGRIATGVMAGIAAFETVKTTFAAIGSATIGANSNMETYLNTLTVVLKSNDKAKETLAWAEKFAASTPFEIPDIVEATTRLSAYGLNAQKVLGATGDMAAVMGKPLMMAVEAVADAQTGELERLKEFGITKGMLIEQAAKMGNKEVVNAKGQITDQKAFNEALFALMNERFKGGMEIQSKTFKGMISNIKDSLGTVARELSRPIFEGLKNQLSSIVPIMSAATQAIKGNWTGVKEILGSAFDEETALKIENFFLSISANIHKAKQWFQSFSPTVENLKTVFMNLMPVFKLVGGAIATAFVGIAKVLPPILNGITGIAAKFTSWSAFVPVVIGLIAAFVSYRTIMAGINAVEKAQNVIKTVNIALTKAQRAAHLAMVVSGGGVRGMLLAMSAAMRALNLSFLANPIVLIVSLLVGLGVALVIAYKKSETFRNVVNSAWSGIKAGFQAFINFFTTTLPAWVSNVINWFVNLGSRIKARFLQDIAQIVALWNSFKTGLVNIVMSLVNGAINIFNTLKPRIMAILQPFITFFVNSWNNLKLLVLGIIGIFTSLLVGDFEGLKLALTAIATAIQRQIINAWNLIKTVVLSVAKFLWSGIKAAFNAGKSAILAIGNAIKNGAIAAWNATKNGVINAAQALWTGAKNAWNNLLSAVKTAATNIKNAAINGFRDAKDGAISRAKEMYNSVRDWITKIPEKFQEMKDNIIKKIKSIDLRQMGKDVVQGFINGLGDKFEDVKKKAKGIADKVKEATANALKLGSPSRIFKDYGRWTGEGYVIGLDGMIKATVKKAAELGNAAKAGVQRAQGAFQNGSIDVGIRPNLASVNALQPSIRGLQAAVSSGNSGDVHNHQWIVQAKEIDEVQKVVRMVGRLRQDVRKGG